MVKEAMEKLKVVTKANVYFDGKVTSRIAYREDGSKLTLGIILPGTYTFDVGDKEIVELIAGECQVLLPGETEWKSVKAGETFVVPANSDYQIRTYVVTEYLCDYVK